MFRNIIVLARLASGHMLLTIDYRLLVVVFSPISYNHRWDSKFEIEIDL